MKYLLPILTVTLALTACGSQMNGAGQTSAAATGMSAMSVSAQPSAQTFLDQLSQVKLNGTTKGPPIQLLSTSLGLPLSSTAQINTLTTQLVAPQALVPQYDGTNASSFALNTIQERMQQYSADQADQQDVVSNIQSTVSSLLKVGQGTATLTWKSGIRTFQTTAVYDQNGLVYDNILSNIVIAEPVTLGSDVTLSKGNATPDAMQPDSTYAFTAPVVDARVNWWWGSKRGEMKISHTILYNGSTYIYNQYGNETSYFDIGSATAQTHNVKLDPRRYALMAWAYAWATPTASFKVSYDSGKASFEISMGGIGSKGDGKGGHTIYLP